MLADLLIYFKTGTTKVMVSSLKELIHGLGEVRWMRFFCRESVRNLKLELMEPLAIFESII